MCEHNSVYPSTSTVSCPQINRAGYVSYPGFNNIYKSRHGSGARFIDLLDQVHLFPLPFLSVSLKGLEFKVSAVDSRIRIRFTSPHPKVLFIC